MKIHCENLICSLFAFFFPPRKNAILFAARAIRVDIHAITFIRVAASMPDVTGSKNPIHLELAGASLAGDTWMLDRGSSATRNWIRALLCIRVPPRVVRPVKLIALCTYDSFAVLFTRYSRTKRENNHDCARRRETKRRRRWMKYCFCGR